MLRVILTDKKIPGIEIVLTLSKDEDCAACKNFEMEAVSQPNYCGECYMCKTCTAMKPEYCPFIKKALEKLKINIEDYSVLVEH